MRIVVTQLERISRYMYMIMPCNMIDCIDIFQRYEYYVTENVSWSDVEPMPSSVMCSVYNRIDAKLVKSSHFTEMRKQLEREVEHAYYLSLQKCIVDYILIDKEERKRLRILSLPFTSPLRYNRSAQTIYMYVYMHCTGLFVPLYLGIMTFNTLVKFRKYNYSLVTQYCWNYRIYGIISETATCTCNMYMHMYYIHRYSHLRFIKCERLCQIDLPMKPSEFQKIFTEHCKECREILEKE